MARNLPTPGPLNLRAALEAKTIEQLKDLLALLPGASTSGKKADLVAAIEHRLAGEGLRALWQQLDKTQQAAVAETVYANGGVFDSARFKARHGGLPAFDAKGSKPGYGRQTPTRLRFFLHPPGLYDTGQGGYLPADLSVRLREFVP